MRSQTSPPRVPCGTERQEQMPPRRHVPERFPERDVSCVYHCGPLRERVEGSGWRPDVRLMWHPIPAVGQCIGQRARAQLIDKGVGGDSKLGSLALVYVRHDPW
jgi:hypothetical protein